MPILFIEQQKRQKYLIIVFIAIISLIILLRAPNFFTNLKKTTVLEPSIETLGLEGIEEPPQIKLNLKTLEDPIFKVLRPFEDSLPERINIGRNNPFNP